MDKMIYYGIITQTYSSCQILYIWLLYFNKEWSTSYHENDVMGEKNKER